MLIASKVRNNVSAVKSVTTYFKRSGLNKKLEKSLKQSNDTRWNSALYMLKSYDENKDDVESILHSKRQGHLLLDIFLLAIADLIKFLECFEETRKELESDRLPTLQKVYLSYWKLKRSLSRKSSDSMCFHSSKKEDCNVWKRSLQFRIFIWPI